MSKQLVLVRHAKSSWKFDTNDFYRPLNRRGLADAEKMARGSIPLVPDLILCSPAIRTYATAATYIREQDWPEHRLSLIPDLYECDAHALIHSIQHVNDNTNCLWIIAHNPGLQWLAEGLLGREIDNIVTSARLEFSLSINQWSDFTGVVGQSELINCCVPVHNPDVPTDIFV